MGAPINEWETPISEWLVLAYGRDQIVRSNQTQNPRDAP
jgi:hypothetical protein